MPDAGHDPLFLTSLDDHVPSRRRYNAGCRCDGCREEMRKWFIRYRDRGGAAPFRTPPPLKEATTELLVTCWCERCSRLVPVGLVLAGQTWSCGPDCHRP